MDLPSVPIDRRTVPFMQVKARKRSQRGRKVSWVQGLATFLSHRGICPDTDRKYGVDVTAKSTLALEP